MIVAVDQRDRILACVGCGVSTTHTFAHAQVDRVSTLTWLRCNVCGLPRSLTTEHEGDVDIDVGDLGGEG